MLSRRTFAPLLGLSALGLGAYEVSRVGLSAPALITPARADGIEGTFALVRRTRKLRFAGVAGTEPYYHRDIATGAWTGFCVSMATDLAHALEAEPEILETTWGNAVLDLQTSKIDVMFGLSPTPARALVLDFSRPFMENTFTAIGKPGLATTWADLNKPEIRVAVDLGSTHDAFARRMLPKATLIALKTADDAVLAVQAGRADCVIQVVMLALVTVKKNPRIGTLMVPTPLIQQPTCIGMRVDADQRFRSFVDSWLEYNKSLGNVRDWITQNLQLVGVSPDDVPPNVQL
jgi:polar amino acid transport system substrate-binding protein